MNAASRLVCTLGVTFGALLTVGCTESERAASSTPPLEQSPEGATSTEAGTFDCPVTIPNATSPPNERPATTRHGNGRLWVVLPTNGRPSIGLAGYAGRVGDGASAKFPVWRADPTAEINIEGRRLDADAPPLEAYIPDGYEGTGFQATDLRFPTLGCWEITVHGGDDALTVVMLLAE
jgi:hypothetical protein